MKKIFSKEVIIGICAILALLILFFGIEFLKGINIFKASNYYYATFSNVEGLSESAPVTVNGFKIGQVREIEYDYAHPGNVIVEIAVNDELKLPTGTKAVLSSDLLGTATIQLHLAEATGEYCPIGSNLESEVASGLMQSLSTDLMPAISAIFPKVDSLLTNVNALVADPALSASIQRLDAISASLQSTTRNLASVTAGLQPVMTDVKDITANVSTITGDFAEVSGKFKNMPLDSLVADLQVTTNNLRRLSEELNNPDSSIGKLLNDPALYDNLNSTISSLDSLFIDIKRNPKRYISIKLL